MLRLLGFAFAAGGILFIVAAAVASYFLWQISRDLPDYEGLANYQPGVMTRVHAGDGSLIGEFAREKRLYVPIGSIPKSVINSFVSAEDQNFYQHNGLDFQGIARAVLTNFAKAAKGGGARMEGASTITQQVAKNFLLTNERSMMRKVKEAILAVRIERAFPKEKILELYLNEIYLGMGSYGVAAAALNYFGKELKDLNIEEAAYLGALPKAPNNYHPFRYADRAIARRNWVIQRVADDGHITQEQAKQAQAAPFKISPRPFGAAQFAAEYFSEEVRRTLIDLYGEDNLYGGGLSVRTTLDPKIQLLARKALRDGLVRYDRKQGYRGPIKKISPAGDWGPALAELDSLADLDPWRLGVVLEASADRATVGVRPGRTANGQVDKKRETVIVPLKNVSWARPAEGSAKGKVKLGKRPKAVSDVLSPGDVIYVAPKEEVAADDDEEDKEDAGTAEGWRLVQVPEIEGSMIVMDPHTGRVLADVGGFSYAGSQFDRGIQAKRQPGSSFKPIVYAAALDNGYTPSSIVVDGPLALEQGNGQATWKPENYENKFYGPSTLRLGLEKSRNLMTVRLAQDLGMPLIAEYARRFGVYDQLMPLLSMALGAGETTLLRLVTGYSSFANGGKQVQATLIDRIQDRYGKTIWRHDNRECPACNAEDWHGQDEPQLADSRKQIIDPHTAYQMTSLMEGVVKRGTGYKVSKVGKPLAGKTGTSNDEKDAWFVGFSPDLVAGVFVGFDNPKPMGKGETGGGIAAPIFRDFMKWALEDKPATPFRVPPGIKLVRIDAKTGMRAQPGATERTILEAYKPNEEPLDPFSFVTYPGADLSGQGGGTAQPDTGFSVGVGGVGGARQPQAGGLY
ncbi:MULTISPECIES: penicillin-binding protein 1A [Rhodomicrobium]|uniref:penicillin-binding protein 1A n=1 Tax=Rhodomicrobium TaxID=1068 RepID=UPI001FDA353F|nr:MULTISPECIES: penicillin-binding protein 1A [Rhodomicrobium]